MPRISSDVSVASRCNSSCSHCFVRARGFRTTSLTPELVRNLIREGYEAGYRSLHLTGGEPLLWTDLPSILDYAFALGYQKAFLNTNGTLLTGKMSRKLAAYKGLTISVSVQGPRRIHDYTRGKGSYHRTLKGIRTAMDTGLPVIIFITVGRSLLPELPRFAGGFFESFPETKEITCIQLIRVAGDVFDLSDEVLSPDDFLRLVRTISFLNLCGLKIDLLNNPLAAVAAKILGVAPFPFSPPMFRPGSIMITAAKRITLAHSTMDDFGIYEPGTLAKIIRSDKYFRAVSPDRLTCPDCVNSLLCSMEGMSRPSEWYRDMFPDVPYCRRVLAKASSYG